MVPYTELKLSVFSGQGNYSNLLLSYFIITVARNCEVAVHYDMDQTSSLINDSQFQSISGEVAATNSTSSGEIIVHFLIDPFYLTKEVILTEKPILN